MPHTALKVRVVPSLAEVDPAAWDRCANPYPAAFESKSQPDESLRQPDESLSQKERFNPFITHAFLNCCEASGSATKRTGWGGAHVLVEDDAGQLLACAPTYVKTHSQGEYVFDHGWADAYERAGGSYYPKLQVCVPFTPAPGRRLLVAAGPREAEARDTLVAGLRAVTEKLDASSLHVTYLTKAEADDLSPRGFLERTNKQFHFFNKNYKTFDDFLATMASRKRKVVKRERKDALAPGIEIEWATGATLTESHWDAFFAFYMDTGGRKWGRPYLNRKFFSMLGEAMADRVLLVMAKRNGKFIAGALNLIGDDALYGRNWGCLEEHPFLHFEVCYYQAIDFALSRGLSRVEAGAQGEHKLLRGYEPVPTYSSHYIPDPRFARAIEDFLKRERREIDRLIEAYGEHTPFRKGELQQETE
jgi:predicted N-acyltransferase